MQPTSVITQHPQVAQTLRATGDGGVVYVDFDSAYWSADGEQGNNRVGRLLEVIRSELAAAEARIWRVAVLSVEDRLAVADVINLHGHFTDSGEFDRMAELFVEDVTYDLSAFGGGVLAGLGAVRESAYALGDANPLAHHVTNIVVEETADGTVRARSKYLGVMKDGAVGSGTYEDVLRRTGDGWRITHRVVRPRRMPLQY